MISRDNVWSMLLTATETADRLNVTAATLANWRSAGKGPVYVRNPDTGRFLGYDSDDVDEWLRTGRKEHHVV